MDILQNDNERFVFQVGKMGREWGRQFPFLPKLIGGIVLFWFVIAFIEQEWIVGLSGALICIATALSFFKFDSGNGSLTRVSLVTIDKTRRTLALQNFGIFGKRLWIQIVAREFPMQRRYFPNALGYKYSFIRKQSIIINLTDIQDILFLEDHMGTGRVASHSNCKRFVVVQSDNTAYIISHDNDSHNAANSINRIYFELKTAVFGPDVFNRQG